MNNMAYPVKLIAALVAAIVTGLVIYIGAALHVYIIAAVVWLISALVG